MITIQARAKVNLYLRVGDKRPDGYHNIQTVFHSIELADTLDIVDAPGLQVTCSTDDAPDGPENLAYRAAVLLRRETGVPYGANIHIRKHIPSQAGLGGGSADAAAVLVALNQIWGLNLDMDVLERMGKDLGADVPFCIRGGAAYAEGVGEQLTPLPALPPAWLLIVKPSASVSTAAAYRMIDATPLRAGPPPDGMLEMFRTGQIDGLPLQLYNDFHGVVLSHHPEIQRASAALQEFSDGVLLCGSGSALLGLVKDEATAVVGKAFLASQGWQAFATRFAAEGTGFIQASQ